MVRNRKPPFRADHVGSLLRPGELKDAREKHDKGEISRDQLRTIEDRCIRDAVKLQEEAGVPAITDGEFRRYEFHTPILTRIHGVELTGRVEFHFHYEDEETTSSRDSRSRSRPCSTRATTTVSGATRR